MIIVKLVREEEGTGEAVILRTVMSIVFVSRDCMNAEASVLILENGKFVVEAEEDRLAVAYLHELGRNGSVVSPGFHRGLGRQIRVKLERDRTGRVNARILVRRNTRIVSVIGFRPFH